MSHSFRHDASGEDSDMMMMTTMMMMIKHAGENHRTL
jgi:hypothetical protein